MPPMSLLADALARHQPADDAEAADLAQIRAFVAEHADPFDRRIAVGHLTGSAIVISADGARTLLLHHRKLDRWLQPGGHADPGETAGEDVALREALEETGLAGLALHPTPRGRWTSTSTTFRRGGPSPPTSTWTCATWSSPRRMPCSRDRPKRPATCAGYPGTKWRRLETEGTTLGPDSGLLRALAKARRIVEPKA